MNNEQPRSDQSNESPEVSATPPEPIQKTSFWKSKAFIIIASILAVSLIAAGVVYVLTLTTKTDEPPQTSSVTPENTEPITKHIYAYSNTELVAINPETKEFTVADTGLSGESGNADLGSTIPLTAPNFESVVYAKDNAGWIINGSEKKLFYSIPEEAKKTGFYTLYLSAWSSDSTKIAFAIGFMCPPFGSSCTTEDEDKAVTGVYVYNLSAETTTKVQATGVVQWLPQSQSIAYFDDTTEPTKLLLNDTATGTTSTLATVPFGFAPQLLISDDATTMIYSAGVNGTQSAATVISAINGTNRNTVKTSTFADLQWPRFVPASNSDYVYSKRKEITCYGGGSGCVSQSLQLVKNGEDKKLVEDIDSRVIGFYNGKAVVVISDGQVGIDPNNPAPYKATVALVDLDSATITTIYEQSAEKNVALDLQIKLRIGQ